jgi:hypothetical protein
MKFSFPRGQNCTSTPDRKQPLQLTSHTSVYAHRRYTKCPPTFFDTPWGAIIYQQCCRLRHNFFYMQKLSFSWMRKTAHFTSRDVHMIINFITLSISRPTDATCNRFLFPIYMCITVHVSSVKRSSSGVSHLTYSLQFLCLCLSAALSCKKLTLHISSVKRSSSGFPHRTYSLQFQCLFLSAAVSCKKLTLHVSRVKRSSSGVPHRTYSLQFLCLCLSAALSCKKLTRHCSRQTQTQKLEAVCTVRNSWWWELDARNM